MDPLLAKGLESMLDYDGNIEEVFGQTFEVEFSTQTGERIPFELKPNGSSIPVTNENCREYVELYIQAFFESIPEVPFSAFKEGFDAVLAGSAIEIFRPDELAELICGSPTLDFNDLEANTQYDGFEKDSNAIKYAISIISNSNIGSFGKLYMK